MLPREEQLATDEEVGYDEEAKDDDDDQEDDVDEGQERPELKGPHAEEEAIPPPPPFHPPFPHETGRSSSSMAYMPLDPAFLQSFSALQMEVLGLQEGYTGMRDDLHSLSGHMNSIDE